MATQQEVIRAFMKSPLNATTSGMAALNNAIKACSNFGSVHKVINRLISDCQNATSADSFLKEKCGIDLDNDDTGAITGSDVGGSQIKTAESIVSESGTARAQVLQSADLPLSFPRKARLHRLNNRLFKGFTVGGLTRLLILSKNLTATASPTRTPQLRKSL